ncbi:Glucan 1,3-beta-glucosidase 3 [Vermiconidia calcicola]|uniref:Glucan 1,3-beta-glucosidase 3 n=1 Tax=Vermiconidia calcicola TaxID=1690605 RepID=A0ACC3NWC5_9PEZI|nr:Glucan 1,3-beta-glucosidase 3 [Vermiconidia calcicola]
MKRFLDKAKATWEDVESTFSSQPQQIPSYESTSATAPPQAPAPADVIRYRYQHGANLGSIFIMERWLTGNMYPHDAPGSSELTASKAWVKAEGMQKARERFERHWAEYVNDHDLDYLRDVAKINAVRLPIGFFTLGPSFCEKTSFEKVAPVYEHAWPAVKSLVERCHARGIGVLIDVHGLPGSANGQDHSGTDSKDVEFWGSKKNRALATKCMAFLAHEVRSMRGVLGLQIVNEATHNAEGMWDLYDDVLSIVSQIDPALPIYISDAWDLPSALGWSMGKNSCRHTHTSSANPVVVDTHLYWAFTAEDHAKSPQQIATEVHTKLSELDNRDGNVFERGACAAFIGEYSCALNPATHEKSGGYPKEDFIRDFGWAQSERYQARSGGCTFWTFKMDWMPGGEWGFKEMVDGGKIKAPLCLQLSKDDVHHRLQNAYAQQVQRRQRTVSKHCQWWDSNHPSYYEHWRFEQGWDLGWADAVAFFQMRNQAGLAGADRIGMLDLWVLMRLRETGNGVAKFGWEFELGLRQAVRDFYEAAGV